MIKVKIKAAVNGTSLRGLCGLIALDKYFETIILMECHAHYLHEMVYPECIECLCQSAELLEGRLNG